MAEIVRCRTCGGGRAKRVLVVSRPADLALLRPWARRFDSIQVAQMGHSYADNAELQSAIERDYLECGCRAARIGFPVALAAVAALAVWIGRPFDEQPIEYWIVAVAVVVVLPLAMMLVTIIRARLRLAARIDRLQRTAE